MNYKKIINYLCVAFMIFLIGISNIDNAAAASFVVSAKNNGNGSATVTVSGNVVGAIKVSLAGQEENVALKTLNSSESVTFKTGAGTFTVKATAISLSDANYNIIEGETITKSVTVTTKSTPVENKPTQSSSGASSASASSESSQKQTTLSNENNLASLSVSQGELSFKASQTSYQLSLMSDVKSIVVNAKAKDSKAQISGTGTHELKIGENNIMISVKAENGDKKTYTISVYVTEKPQVYLEMNSKSLGVINDFSKIDTPKGFEKTTIERDNEKLTALKSSTLDLTLLYLQDENGDGAFYIYENDTVIRKYETLTVHGIEYICLDFPKGLKGVEGMSTGEVMINKKTLPCWIYKDNEHENYVIVYLMNQTGEKSLYSYEKTEGTLQKYTPIQESQTLIYILSGISLGLFVGVIGLGIAHYRFKKKSIATVKEYYEKRNRIE